MTPMRRYLLPLLAAALIAVGIGSLWNHLLLFAVNDWLKVLLYLAMCVLAVASMIAAQAMLLRTHHPFDAAHPGTRHEPLHSGPPFTPEAPGTHTFTQDRCGRPKRGTG